MGARDVQQAAIAILQAIPNNMANAGAIAQARAIIAQQNVREQWYQYEANLTLAAGATGSVQLNIQGDAPFRIESAMCWATNNAALTALTPNTRITPLALITLNDQSGPGNLMPSGVPVQNLFGEQGIPFIWQRPYTMPANSVLQITGQSYDTTIAMTLYFTFGGVKLLPGQVG